MEVRFLFFCLWVPAAGLFCMSMADVCHNATTNNGKEFLLGFTGLYYQKNITLSIAARTSSVVIVEAQVPNINTTYHIHPGITEITISEAMRHTRSGIDNKGLFLRSTSDVSVLVMYRPTPINNLGEVTLALPTPILSTSYVVPSYAQWSSTLYARLLVAALQDNTSLQIRIKTTATVSYNSSVYSDGDTIQVSIQRFQTFVLNSNKGDISGTIVDSSAPVAVFIVNDCIEIPVSFYDCDYITTQLLPLDRWGNNFIVPPLYPRDAYLIRIFAYYNNTAVSIYNNTKSQSKIIRRGEFWEESLGNDSLVVTSNSSIQVIQYSFSNIYGPAYGQGDPFMSIVPAVEQFSSDYLFFAEHKGYFGKFSNYVSVTIQKSQISGLRLDGSPLQFLHHIAVSRPSESYSIVTVGIQSGSHTLNHTDTSVRFAALVYGYVSAIGYGYPAGMTFSTNGILTCYACTEMQGLHFCDKIERCSSNEVCFARKVETHHGHVRYNSGCVRQDFFGAGDKLLCNECCTSDFCNNKGCGDAGLPLRTNRGPICFDCSHFKDPQECDKVTVCSKLEVCSIEEFRWGEQELDFIMGCKPREECSQTEVVARRAIPICHSCCEQDYCNTNCTHQYKQPIIG